METLGSYANLSAHRLSDLTGASLATVRRWKRTNRVPVVVLRYLRLLSHGAVSTAAAWAGWSVREDGKLHSPEGSAFTPGEIRALPLRLQQISAMEAERRLAQPVRDEDRRRDREDHRPGRQPPSGDSHSFHELPALLEAAITSARRQSSSLSCHVSISFSVSPSPVAPPAPSQPQTMRLTVTPSRPPPALHL